MQVVHSICKYGTQVLLKTVSMQLRLESSQQATGMSYSQ